MHSPRFSPKFILSFVLAFLLSSTAFAQTGAFKDFALDRYTPGIDRESVAGVELGEVPLHLSWDALLWAGYSHNVLMLARDDGDTTDRVGSIIGQRFTTHLGASISLFDWIQIGVDLPFIASQARGDEPSPPDASLGELTQSGLGDLRISPKIPLLSADKAFVDVALLPVFTIPTATQDAYLGEDGISATPSIAISKRFGGLRIALNAGYFWRPSNTFLDLDIGPETRFSLGAAQDLNTLINIPIEVGGAIHAATPATAPFSKIGESPAEALFQGAYYHSSGFGVIVGGALGLVAGFGTPDFRTFLALRFAPRDGDADGDRVSDSQDKCPEIAEDSDGFEDWDGCPDVDNDDDGIPDVKDQCPNEAETENGIDDEDGCPEELKIVVQDQRLEISDKIHFRSGHSTIKTRSFPLLDAIAEILKARPNIKKLKIVGHTDNKGKAKVNLRLSQARAEAVRQHLIELGIATERLISEGMGETTPLTSNKRRRGRALNRRVEFLIIETLE